MIKTDKISCTFYFENDIPLAISFTLPRGVVQFHKLENLKEEEIIDLIKQTNVAPLTS